MFNPLFLLAALLLSSFTISANTISRSEAQQKAEAFGLATGRTVKSQARRVADAYDTEASQNNQHYYAFDYEGNQGFVIVNARAESPVEIMAYSFEGSAEALAPAAKELLESYTPSATSTGDNLAIELYGPFSPVEPMLTSIWNQSSPYNLACPEDTYEAGSVSLTGPSAAGCVALAMAQIMNYHKYPATFDWNLIHDKHTDQSPAADNAEVARLIHEAGLAVGTIYGYLSSGAHMSNVRSALVDQFGYSAMAEYRTEALSTTALDALVYSELQQGRPVCYGAFASNGHSFVCDGMDADGYLHINWGWGGMSNGYFHPTLLDPGVHGIGGSNGAYVNQIEIIAGIRKPEVTDKEIPTFFFISLSALDNANVEVHLIERSYEMYPENYPELTFGLRFKKIDSGDIVDVVTKANGYRFTLGDCSLVDGDYRVFPIWRLAATDNWQYIWPQSSISQPYLKASVSNGTIEFLPMQEYEDAKLTLTDVKLAVTADPYTNDELRFTLHNTGAPFQSNRNLYAVFTTDKGEAFRVVVNKGVRSEIPSGGSLEVVYNYSELLKESSIVIPAGKLHVALEDEYLGKIADLGDVTILTKGFDAAAIECPVLREYLTRKLLGSGTTYFSDYTISKIDELEINGIEVSSLKGLEKFPALSWIKMFDSKALVEAEIAGFPNLQILWLDMCPNLKKAVVKDNPMLHDIVLFANALESLEVGGNCTEFEDDLIVGFSLTVSENKLTSLDLSRQENLRGVSASSNRITEISLPASLAKLASFDITDNNVEKLEFTSPLPALVQFNVKNNSLESLDLSSATQLVQLDAENNRLKDVKLPESASLLQVNLSDNNLPNIDIAGCSNLTDLFVSGNDLSDLDISKCLKLQNFAAADNPNLCICDFRSFDFLRRINICDTKALFCALQPRDYDSVYFRTETNAVFDNDGLDLTPLVAQGLDLKMVRPYENCELVGSKLKLVDPERRLLGYIYSADENATYNDIYYDYSILVLATDALPRVDIKEVCLPDIGSEAIFKIYDPARSYLSIGYDETIELDTDNFGHYEPIDEWSSRYVHEGTLCTVRRVAEGDTDIKITAHGVNYTIRVTSVSGIDEVNSDVQATPVAYYNLQGIRVSGVLPGQITIVVYSDGTTRKYLKK